MLFFLGIIILFFGVFNLYKFLKVAVPILDNYKEISIYLSVEKLARYDFILAITEVVLGIIILAYLFIKNKGYK